MDRPKDTKLGPTQVAELVALSATMSQADLAKHFGITIPAVSYHLKKHGVARERERKLSPEAVDFVRSTTGRELPAIQLAAILGVSRQMIYGLWGSDPDENTKPANTQVGYKVTKDILATILNPGLSAFDSAIAAGVSVPTVYHYRRKHKADAARTAAVDDLV